MGGINLKRMVIGGLAAALVIWLTEGAGSVLYQADMEAALQAHGLSMPATAGMIATSVLLSLLAGMTLVFFYAASRPRFGPGPKTALIVAFVIWLGGYVVSLLGWAMLDLFPATMLVLWSAIGLFEIVVAAQVGAWLYRES